MGMAVMTIKTIPPQMDIYAQADRLRNGLNELDISSGFQVTLSEYNSMHARMNNGLNLLMNVYRDTNNKLHELEDKNMLLVSKIKDYRHYTAELEHYIRGLEVKNRVLNDTSNAFACLIIDGDGALFKEEYLAQGEEGGREAAHKLHSAVKTYLDSANMEDHIKSIVAKVYLNVEGLTKVLMESGIIHGEDQLTKFGRGFCQAQPFFEFIDVGHGKEKADLKATKHFHLMLHLKECKRVMLAGCHDNGYATYLEEYRWACDKITLVETTPAANGVAKLKQHFDFRQFPDVFRSDPLCLKKRSQQHYPFPTSYGNIEAPLSPPSTYATKTQEPAIGKKNHPATPSDAQTSRGASPSAALMKTPSPTQAAATPTPSLDDPQEKNHQPADDEGWQPVSYAKVAGYTKVGRMASSNDPVIDNFRNPQPKTEKLYFYLNEAQQRLDHPLARPPDNQTRQDMEERTKRNGANYCNGHHLIKRCKHLAENNHGDCDYIHGAPLSEKDKKFLWYKARSVICRNGSDCREDYCLAGHHCAWGKDCRIGRECRFKKTHGMDLVSTLLPFPENEDTDY
ncbi:hypothetical protein N0V85_009125 [Neurospora sp. IMI 360204]|nr:hypothetical protein N0V85_009125 [Neurospora sp. IMI 360204]